MDRGYIKTLVKFIMPIASVAIIILSEINIYSVFSSISLKEVYASATPIKSSSIFVAKLFAILSYICLIGYDFIATSQANIRASYSLVTLAAFSSYCICFNLGFPVVTGPAIRYCLYSRESVSPKQIVYITTITSITFLLGLVVLGCIGLIFGANDLSRLYNYSKYLNLLLGILIRSFIF